MTRRLPALLPLFLAAPPAPAAGPPDPAKQALQELGEFVGRWPGSADGRVNGKKAVWKETVEVGWQFGKGDPKLVVAVDGGKFLTAAEVRFDPTRKVYVLAVTHAAGPPAEYAGKLRKGRLVADAKLPNGDVRKLTAYTVSDGARLVLQVEGKAGGGGPSEGLYQLAANKEGEAFAGGGGKKNECVVTGGLGTMPVSFDGKTYYVCCTGCRDEFLADPKKYVAAFEQKRK